MFATLFQVADALEGYAGIAEVLRTSINESRVGAHQLPCVIVEVDKPYTPKLELENSQVIEKACTLPVTVVVAIDDTNKVASITQAGTIADACMEKIAELYGADNVSFEDVACAPIKFAKTECFAVTIMAVISTAS